MKNPTLFRQFMYWLNDEDRHRLDELFNDIRDRLFLNKNDTNLIISDFENLILYYVVSGLNVDQILKRINADMLSDFYHQKQENDWYPLDSAAKIYPLTMSHNWMALFRVSAYLDRTIVPEVLQMALNFTIKRFPYFATTLKKGLFWHYSDGTATRFQVKKERRLPCSKIDVSRSGVASFRVRYYQNRISVEFFHILTDGHGAMLFLKTLTGEYLRLLGVAVPYTEGIFDVSDEPLLGEAKDAFGIADKTETMSGFHEKKPLHINGKRSFNQPDQIIHFEMSASSLKDLARSKNTTITSLIVTIMAFAVKETLKDKKTKPNEQINIQVPVNMRKFYDTQSLRNFSMYCVIRLFWKDFTTFDDTLSIVNKQLLAGTSKEELDKTMTLANRLVATLRYIPLALKRIVTIIIYGFLGDNVITTTLSNLGVVKVPDEIGKYIDKFDFILGSPSKGKAACSMITFKDKTIFSISKATADPGFELSILKCLEDMNIKINVYGSTQQ